MFARFNLATIVVVLLSSSRFVFAAPRSSRSLNCTPSQYGDSEFECLDCDLQCDLSLGCTGGGPRACLKCKDFLNVELGILECVSECDRNNSYSSGDSLCLPCHPLCTANELNGVSCTGGGPDACSACKRYNRGGVCLDECASNEYPNFEDRSCHECNSLCADSCSGPTTNECIQCAQFRMDDDSCSASCPADSHFAWADVVYGGMRCSPCSSGCNQDPNVTSIAVVSTGCTGFTPRDCQVCKLWYFERDGCVDECVHGSYSIIAPLPTNDPNITTTPSGSDQALLGNCQPCHSQCDDSAMCVGPLSTDCEACANVKFNDVCLESCPDRMYNDPSVDRRCRPCSFQCTLGCTGPTQLDCVSQDVADPVDLDGSGSDEEAFIDAAFYGCRLFAVIVATKTNKTDIVVECVDTCPTSFWADESFDSVGICRACTKTKYTDNTCKCDTGLYFDSDASTDLCVSCDDRCGGAGCTAPTNNDCVKCAVAFPALDGACVASCPSSHYQDGSTCHRCHPTCHPLVGCAGPSSYDCIPLQECPNRTFFDTETATCKTCATHCGDAGCTGQAESDCLRCGVHSDDVTEHTYVLLDGSCERECPTTSFRVWDASRNNFGCETCHSGCTIEGCVGSDTEGCRRCESGLRDVETERCVATCASQSTGGLRSDVSSAAWQPHWVDTEVCVACSPFCRTCNAGNDPDACTECTNVRGLNGRCQDECGNHELAQGPSENRTCVCDDSAFEALEDVGGARELRQCVACHPQCESKCADTTASTCTSCRTFSRLGVCVGVCPMNERPDSQAECVCMLNYYRNDTTGECQACDQNCRGCSGSGPSQCDQCVGPAQITNDNQTICVARCDPFQAAKTSVQALPVAITTCLPCDPECENGCSRPQDSRQCTATASGSRRCVNAVNSQNTTCVSACKPNEPFVRKQFSGDLLCAKVCLDTEPYAPENATAATGFRPCVINCAELGVDFIAHESTPFTCRQLTQEELLGLGFRHSDSPGTNWIVFVAGGCLLTIVVIAIVSRVVRRFNNKKQSADIDHYGLENTLANLDRAQVRAKRKEVVNLENAMITPTVSEFTAANFDSIPTNMLAMGFETPLQKVHNRYRNILPNPQTAVRLRKYKVEHRKDLNVAISTPGGATDSTRWSKDDQYINANFIRGFQGARRCYIAAQAPKSVGVPRFWRMVWQQKVKGIVMLTTLEENGKEKCAQYWPASPGDTWSAEEFTIKNVSQQREDGFLLTEFLVSKRSLKKHGSTLAESGAPLFSEETRTVYHHWVDSWLDKHVPSGHNSLFPLLDAVSKLPISEPLLVHCSAGIGRTGVFIALDWALDALHNVGVFDLQACLTSMRNDRGGMLQTHEQVVYVLEAAKLYVETHNGEPNSASTPSRTPRFEISLDVATSEFPATMRGIDGSADDEPLPSLHEHHIQLQLSASTDNGLVFGGAMNFDDVISKGPGVFVGAKRPGSTAATHKGVSLGYQITSVNRVDTESATIVDVQNYLREAYSNPTGVVELRLRRNDTLLDRYNASHLSPNDKTKANRMIAADINSALDEIEDGPESDGPDLFAEAVRSSWLHNAMSMDVASKKLSDKHGEFVDGVFLVAKSERNANHYVLNVNHNGKPTRHLMEVGPDGTMMVNRKKVDGYHSLEQFLRAAMTKALPPACPVLLSRLVHPKAGQVVSIAQSTPTPQQQQQQQPIKKPPVTTPVFETWVHPTTKGKEAAYGRLKDESGAILPDGSFLIEKPRPTEAVDKPSGWWDKTFVLNVVFKGRGTRHLIEPHEDDGVMVVNRKRYGDFKAIEEFMSEIMTAPLPRKWPVLLTEPIMPKPEEISKPNNTCVGCEKILNTNGGEVNKDGQWTCWKCYGDEAPPTPTADLSAKKCIAQLKALGVDPAVYKSAKTEEDLRQMLQAIRARHAAYSELPPESKAGDGPQEITVKLAKSETQKLGMRIDDNKCVTGISMVGSAYTSAQVKVGFEIRQIDGIDCTALDKPETLKLLTKKDATLVEIVFLIPEVEADAAEKLDKQGNDNEDINDDDDNEKKPKEVVYASTKEVEPKKKKKVTPTKVKVKQRYLTESPNPTRGTIGFNLKRVGDTLTVAAIQPGAETKITPGMQILAINGTDVSMFTKEEYLAHWKEGLARGKETEVQLLDPAITPVDIVEITLSKLRSKQMGLTFEDKEGMVTVVNVSHDSTLADKVERGYGVFKVNGELALGCSKDKVMEMINEEIPGEIPGEATVTIHFLPPWRTRLIPVNEAKINDDDDNEDKRKEVVYTEVNLNLGQYIAKLSNIGVNAKQYAKSGTIEDVRKMFKIYDPLRKNKVLDDTLICVRLPKSPTLKLGLKLDSNTKCVVGIHPGGSAYTDGNIRVGFEVVEIDGVDCTPLTKPECINLLTKPTSDVDIVFRWKTPRSNKSFKKFVEPSKNEFMAQISNIF